MATIRCAHCKQTHNSVEEVKACAFYRMPSRVESDRLAPRTAPPPATPPATTTRYFTSQAFAERIPAGRYALAGSDDIVRFYQADVPKRGKWVGYVFIKQLHGAPGNWATAKVARAEAIAIMERIAEDPVAAAKLFGQKTETCGRCASPLTQIRSRAAGYGEKCASVLGWPYPSAAEAEATLGEGRGA